MQARIGFAPATPMVYSTYDTNHNFYIDSSVLDRPVELVKDLAMPERKPERMYETLAAKQQALYETTAKMEALMRTIRINEQTMALALQTKMDLASISEEDKVKIAELANIVPTSSAPGTTHELEIAPHSDHDDMEVDEVLPSPSSKKQAPKKSEENGTAKSRRPRVKQTAARRASSVSQTQQHAKTAQPTIEDSQAFMESVVAQGDAAPDADPDEALKYMDDKLQGSKHGDEEEQYDEEDYGEGEYDEEYQEETGADEVQGVEAEYLKWQQDRAAPKADDDVDEYD
eukprot:TRINITY_DN14662_c0_g1_i1.p1 TRINITY_DN14662_c0_g1~~TRINITY_DN14662_c0_g1_i1.p1  ORF type:complete len:287 (-),score=89.51 TRINITY_DN14662_c0_g1_i1:161-1021(-)